MDKSKITSWMNRVIERTVYSKPLKKELILILEDLFKIYSPTGQEAPVVEYCKPILKRAGFTLYTDAVTNLYAQRGSATGEKLVCINAHTDTVQDESDSDVANYVQYRWLEDMFTGQGKMLGGDDKCGIAVALTLAMGTTLPMKIILTSGEERGGKGAEALTQDDFNNVLCCFTIDRKSGHDLISEYCGRTCAPKEFVKAFMTIAERDAGVKFVDVMGSYADTYVISKYTPCVNLSAGYYNAHTDKDFVDVNELYNVMISVKAAIEHAGDLRAAIESAPQNWRHDKFANNPYYVRGKYQYSGGAGWGEGGMWAEYYDIPVGVSAGTTGLIDLSATKPKHVQTSPKTIRRKCQVTYGKQYGEDDVTRNKNGKISVQTGIDSHLKEIMTTDEGILLAQYNDFKISDGEWEDMLMDGRIQPFVYRIGIDGRARYRRSTGLLPESKEIGDDETDNTFIDLVTEAATAIDDIGNRSGYLPGTSERDFFIEFVTGGVTVAELTSMLSKGEIDQWFYDNAIESRNDYEDELRLKHMQQIYEEEQYEKEQYKLNKNRLPFGFDFVEPDQLTESEKLHIVQYALGRITDMEWDHRFDSGQIGETEYTQAIHERNVYISEGRLTRDYGIFPRFPGKENAGKHPNRGIGHLSDDEKHLIISVADGTITINMWKEMLKHKEITKSVYRAGINERNYFTNYHKLSGRFAPTSDEEEDDEVERDDGGNF